MHQPPDDRRDRRAGSRAASSGSRPRPSNGAARSGTRSARPNRAAAATPAPESASPPSTRGAFTLSGNVGRATVALLSVIVLIVTGYAWHSITSLQNGVTRLDGLNLGDGKDGAVDILMVGTDSRTDAQGNPLSASEAAQLHAGDEVATNTDTILLIRIPNDGSSATAISIPRDSYVDVPGIGMSKINAAYGATREARRAALVESGTDAADAEKQATEAGRKALIQTVAQLTGVQVDRYAEVGLVGFVLLTNAVGGVDVCLKNPVDEPLSGARFRAGRQTLTGPQALSFVRQRHDLPRGDLDRIVRQQVFMAALAQKVLSAGTLTDPSRLSALEEAVSRSIVIDNDWDILKFVEQLKDLTGGKVKFATIPVVNEQGWSEDGEQSVVTVDPAAVQRFTSALLTKKTGALARDEYTVDVTNAGTVDGLATNVAGLVASRGFTRGTTDTKAGNDADSYVATSETSAGATDLAKQMGNLPVRVDNSVPSGHLRLVLTDSYVGPGSISDTGQQDRGSGSGTTATPAAATSAAPPITAAGSGPECVN